MSITEADDTLNADESGLFPAGEDNYGEVSGTEFVEGYVSSFKNVDRFRVNKGGASNRLPPSPVSN